MPAALARGTMRKGAGRGRSANRYPTRQTPQAPPPAIAAPILIPSAACRSKTPDASPSETASHLRYDTAAAAGRAAIASQPIPPPAPPSTSKRHPPPPINTTLRHQRRQPRNAPPSSFSFRRGNTKRALNPSPSQDVDWPGQRLHNIQVAAAVLDLNNSDPRSKPVRSASVTFGRSDPASIASPTWPAPEARAMSDSAALMSPGAPISRREWLVKEVTGGVAFVKDFWRRHEERKAVRPRTRHFSMDGSLPASPPADTTAVAATPKRRFSLKSIRRWSSGRQSTNPVRNRNSQRDESSNYQQPVHLRYKNGQTQYWDHDHRVPQSEGGVMVESSRNNSTVTNFGDLMHRAMNTEQVPPPVPSKAPSRSQPAVPPLRPPRPLTPDLPLRRVDTPQSTLTRSSAETSRSLKLSSQTRGSLETTHSLKPSLHRSKLSSTLQGAQEHFTRRSRSSRQRKQSTNGLTSPMSIACAGADTVTLSDVSFSPVRPRADSSSLTSNSADSACGNCSQRGVALFSGFCGMCGGKNRFFSARSGGYKRQARSVYGDGARIEGEQNFTRESLVPEPLRVQSASPPNTKKPLQSAGADKAVPDSLLNFRARMASCASSIYVACPESTPRSPSPVAFAPPASTYKDLGNPFESDLGWRPTPPPLPKSSLASGSRQRPSKPDWQGRVDGARGSSGLHGERATGLGIAGVSGPPHTIVTRESSKSDVKRKPVPPLKRPDNVGRSYVPPPIPGDNEHDYGARDTKFYEFYKMVFNDWKTPVGTPRPRKRSGS